MLNLGFSLEYFPSQPWVIRQFCIILVHGRGMVAGATKGVVGVHLQRHVVGRSHNQPPTLNDVNDPKPDDLIVVYILNKIRAF
jgi:hypothetical protein